VGDLQPDLPHAPTGHVFLRFITWWTVHHVWRTAWCAVVGSAGHTTRNTVAHARRDRRDLHSHWIQCVEVAL